MSLAKCTGSGAILLLALLTGCHHPARSPTASRTQARRQAPTIPPSETQPAIPSGKVIFTEVGDATWYHARTPNELTAAHKTLPYNTLVHVTNLVTGQQATVRINDRGPFVRGRVLDLSAAAAKATGIYRMGIAKVRLEVFSAPAPVATGGRWAVQIGAFSEAADAESLRRALTQQFPAANVVEYTSATGHWIRVRPPHDEKRLAMEIADFVTPARGEAYLVRLD